MTEKLQWRHATSDFARLVSSLLEADTNGNGWLLDPEDRLPQFQIGPKKSGLVMTTPTVQALYRSSAVKNAKGEMTILLENPSKKTVSSQDIVEMMHRNGGHLMRVGDLARLF